VVVLCTGNQEAQLPGTQQQQQKIRTQKQHAHNSNNAAVCNISDGYTHELLR
jgi:hypothetical protein